MSTKSEALFNEKMKNIFIGEEINGNSGYVNLMKIKSKYFEEKLDELHSIIDEKSVEFEDPKYFRSEVYDKLYSFVKKYFSDSGSVYFFGSSLSDTVYEEVYSENEDISLFWKTHMLYYVKTGEVWEELEINKYDLEEGTYDIEFSIDNIEGRLASEKKDIVFNIEEVEKEKLTFSVSYTSTGYGMSDSKIDELRRKLKDKDVEITNENLKNLFKKFKKQNEVDYFINKNAEKFLKEKFDIQIKNYMMDDITEFREDRIHQLKSIKDIAYTLIDFIGKFEEELSSIWNKTRFVRKSNYVISYNELINYTSEEFAIDYIKHGDAKEQKNEWERMGLTDKIDREIKDILEEKPNLPIDSQYFDRKVMEKNIENIERKQDGILIKSENYQALNTLSRKLRNNIQSIYIDPPFNKNEDANFAYKVNYKDSTWITLLENRLKLCKELMFDQSSIFVRSDNNGNSLLRLLMDDIFGEENYRNEITVRRGSDKSALYSHSEYSGMRSLGTNSDSLFWYTKDPELRFDNSRVQVKMEERRDPYWTGFKKTVKENATSDSMNYEVCGIDTDEDFGWMWEKGRGKQAEENYKEYLEISEQTGETVEEYWKRTGKEKNFVRKNENNTIQYWVEPKEYKFLNNLWTDINGYSSKTGFSTENSEKLLERVITVTSEEGEVVLDFFMGSGTTQAVAQKMNREWIGVELGDQFYDVALPRMKKVISGKDTGMDYSGGGFFKYYELEQYEDILRNMSYSSRDTLSNFTDSWDDYMFMSDEKLADKVLDKDESDIRVTLEDLYEDIDVPETLSLLLGKKIKKIYDNKVEFEDGSTVSTENPPVDKVKPLLWWGDQ